MNHPSPRTIREYLDQLREELRGADSAMIQDALYDAEEHLRAELAEHPDLDEAVVLGRIVSSYGAPDEVAEIYRVKEGEVELALRPPRAARLIGAKVLLVDDVLTSGATSHACVSVLKAAGAERVIVGCFARVLDEA